MADHPHMLACSVLKLRGMDLIERAVQIRTQLYAGDTFPYHLEQAREAIAEATAALDTIEKEFDRRNLRPLAIITKS